MCTTVVYPGCMCTTVVYPGIMDGEEYPGIMDGEEYPGMYNGTGVYPGMYNGTGVYPGIMDGWERGTWASWTGRREVPGLYTTLPYPGCTYTTLPCLPVYRPGYT